MAAIGRPRDAARPRTICLGLHSPLDTLNVKDPDVLRFCVSVALLISLGVTAAGAAAGAAAGDPATPIAAPIETSAATVRTVMVDGTTCERWTLRSGLRVVTRHIPGARTTAITLCYRLGTREDPPSREGLAELVGQVAFTGRSGDVPARSMLELEQLRPAGWSLGVGPYLTVMTEACPTEFLPSVLHQVGERLLGVAVSDTSLRRSRTEVQRRLRANYDMQPEKTLHFLSGEMVAGRSAERAMRYATGKGLEGVSSADVATLLKDRLCPANTVLAIVGNLDGFNLHALTEQQLAAAAPGTAAPPLAWGNGFASVASLGRPDLKAPLGVVAIIGPALTDTMHAYFMAFTVSAAAPLSRAWGKPEPPMNSRFQYSLVTDPQLVRFYPPVTQKVSPATAMDATLNTNSDAIVDSSAIAVAAETMIWRTGGPLPGDLLKRARTDATVIHTLASTLASLESYADESFWEQYRARLLRAHTFDLSLFFKLYFDPKRRVELVLHPQN